MGKDFEYFIRQANRDIQYFEEKGYYELKEYVASLLSRNEELEEKNKNLQQRINKAIEYIKENKTKYCLGRNEFTCELKYSDELVKASEVEDILKGEE